MALDVSKVHPTLLAKVAKVLHAMEVMGHPMRICQAVRTVAEQQALYAQGRTTPGAIVTRCDGVVKKSNHQLHDDGFGHAVDCCFTTGEPFGEHQPWADYGHRAEAEGLIWGGGHSHGWHGQDRPHIELP